MAGAGGVVGDARLASFGDLCRPVREVGGPRRRRLSRADREVVRASDALDLVLAAERGDDICAERRERGLVLRLEQPFEVPLDRVLLRHVLRGLDLLVVHRVLPDPVAAGVRPLVGAAVGMPGAVEAHAALSDELRGARAGGSEDLEVHGEPPVEQIPHVGELAGAVDRVEEEERRSGQPLPLVGARLRLEGLCATRSPRPRRRCARRRRSARAWGWRRSRDGRASS